MAPRRKKHIANVRIQLPPETRAQQGYTPFEELNGDGWNVIVPAPPYGFEEARATIGRKNTFNPWCSTDLHRYIHRLVTDYNANEPISAQHFYEGVVLQLIIQHGSLFNDEELLLSEWLTELDRIRDVVAIAEAYRDGDLNNDDDDDAKAALEEILTGAYEGALAIGLDGVELRPTNLIDYAWLLIARDCWQQITYSTCLGCQLNPNLHPRDWREVPSTGLPTPRFRTGRTVRFCGKRCANRSSASTDATKASERALSAPKAALDKQQAAEKDLAEALEKLNKMGGTEAVGEELDSALEKLNALEGSDG